MKARGIIELNGKLGDLVFYTLNGKTVVRRAGRVSRKRYREDTAFENLRQNQSEFGLSSHTGKIIRTGLGPYRDWGDTTVSGRLTGFIRKIIQQGQGEAGKRSLERKALDQLMDFNFDQKRLLSNVLRSLPELNINREKMSVQMRFENLKASRDIKVPGSAQKVIFTAGLIALSEVHYTNGYETLHPQFDGLHQFTETGISIEELALPFNVKVELKQNEKPPKEVAFLLLLGVEFDSSSKSRTGKVLAVF